MSTTSTLVNNRYRVVRELGKGGFGATFLVEDTQLPSGKRFVLKELMPIENNEETYTLIKQRFEREAVILEELGNVSLQIPSLYAYFAENSRFYLVQEYVEGETLSQRVMEQGVMSDAAVKEWLSGILPVLACVHEKGIIHRDIKPENVILRSRDHKPVLIDFGAVRETMGTQINANGKSTQSIVIGTPGFMPSEQAAGRAVFGSDLYSLGLTAVYALTGKIPQELPTNPMTGDIQWRQYAPSVSAGLASVIDRAIALGIQGRFQTSAQMLDALLVTEAPMGIPGTVVSMSPSGAYARPPMGESQATIVAAHPSQAGQPQYSQAISNTYPSQVSQPQSNGEWKKALITGGLIGVSILLGSVVMKAQIPGFMGGSSSPEQSVKTASKEEDSNKKDSSEKPKEKPSEAPAVQPPQPVVVQAAQPAPAVNAAISLSEMNATVVGEAGSKNIRSGPGTNTGVLHSVNPGDRVKVVGTGDDSGRNPWYKVIIANGADGWIAAQLIHRDGESAPAAVRAAVSQAMSQPSRSTGDTNGTVKGEGGSKNVRTGPGTKYPTEHECYPGDRVKIIDQNTDSGGYVWYKVYFPKSGASGWMAAQLIRPD
jgi:serine/threonine protein kinase, bacterial